jgi:signal transduction histidine kinase
MVNFFRKNIIHRFFNLREYVRNGVSYDEIIRIEILISMTVFSHLFSLIYLPIALLIGVSKLTIINYSLYLFVCIPLVLYFINKNKYNVSKLIMFVLGTTFMFVKAGSLGPSSGMNISMLIICFASFAFWTLKDYYYIIICNSVVILLITILEFYNYKLFEIHFTTTPFEYYFNLYSTIFFCILFFYVTIRINQYSIYKVNRVNKQLLINNNSLKKVNADLDSYLYRASHDMRAPLTSMMGLIQMLKSSKSVNDIQSITDLQLKCVQKLDDNIQQIIHLSRNSNATLKIEKINLNQLCVSIYEDIKDQTHAVDFNVNVLENAPLYNDNYRLTTVLNNLISNAIKYINLEVKEHHIDIDAEITLDELKFTIKDNGIGINNENLPHIFKMFYRATDKSKGTGLGLFIVQEIIKKLNGKIEVHSEVNKYTEFIFTIPNQIPL